MQGPLPGSTALSSRRLRPLPYRACQAFKKLLTDKADVEGLPESGEGGACRRLALAAVPAAAPPASRRWH